MISDSLGEHVLFLPAGDRLSVTLRVLPGATPGSVTAEEITALCDARDISKRSIDHDEIERVLAAFDSDPGQVAEGVIARGVHPRQGEPGRLELDPDLAEQLEKVRSASERERIASSDEDEKQRKKPDRAATGEAGANPDTEGDTGGGDPGGGDPEGGAVDHYNKSAFVIVRRGTELGRIIPPTLGEDGTDVHGETVTATPGRRYKLERHKSITVRRDGTVVANTHGRLIARPGQVRVDPELRIRGAVDFSTGNVRFPGDVNITEGIKDRFRVECDRNVRVTRLVEAAHIIAGLDAELVTGIAGRDQGEVHAARDLRAGYLDAVTATAGRDCIVDREISACDLTVGRHLVVAGGFIRAGVTRVGCSIDAGMIGARGGTDTLIEVGRPAALCELVRRIEETEPEIEDLARSVSDELENFPRGAKLTAQQAEMLCELEFRAASMKSIHTPIIEARRRLDDLRRSIPLPSVSFKKAFEEGTVLLLGPYRIEAKSPVKGPMRIDLPADGPPMVRETATGNVANADKHFDVSLQTGQVDLRVAPSDADAMMASDDHAPSMMKRA